MELVHEKHEMPAYPISCFSWTNCFFWDDNGYNPHFINEYF